MALFKNLRKAALEYHSKERKGKIEVTLTKPCVTQKDLSLAYTPGVAEPCREIVKDKSKVFEYTAKGNLVAVITNGTAVLGLGNIGALASKPVMEGKGVLFKRFADIDVFDIEINAEDPDVFVETVKRLEPTFGGINLEDIKAPECFYIEERLKNEMEIPIFHDDQHGTAIISGAGFLNALELVGKRIDEVRVIFCGGGASGIACAKYYLRLGVKKENLIMCDSKGVIYKGREEGMNPYKEELAQDTNLRTLKDALKGADVFVGVSVGGIVTPEMIKSMAPNPIVFAMANPDPEISYEDAIKARRDIIMATGRSDYPNQVNNVLGFPFIFRGALDVESKAINEEMKIAATKALADLAKEGVPAKVAEAYGMESIKFGKDYIIPKPLDPRVLLWEAVAVAKAAMETGVARIKVDLEEYRERLEARLGKARRIMRVMINKAKRQPKRIVYPEGENSAILKACEIILDEGIAYPILIGEEKKIIAKIEEHNLNIKGKVEIVHPASFPRFDDYVFEFYSLRQRKGITMREAKELLLNPNYFGSMMVHKGDADGLVSGLTHHYPDTIRPALQVIRVKDGVRKVAGLYVICVQGGIYFFADTTVNIEPTAEDLAEIAILVAKQVKRFDVTPRVAMLSFSNFGSTRHPLSDKIRKAVEIVKQREPDLLIDGEMEADTAVVPEILDKNYPFSTLKGKGGANVLIFPDLQSGNIAYKLIQRLGNAEAIGPILLGMRKPVHVLQIGTMNEVDVVNMTAIAVVDAQEAES